MIEKLLDCINNVKNAVDDEQELKQLLDKKFTPSLCRKLLRENTEIVVEDTVFVYHRRDKVWTKVADVSRRPGVKHPIVTWYSNYGKDVSYCLGENPDHIIEQMVQHLQ